MSGPKHLWSGDWESESARTAQEAPRLVFDPEPQPEPAPRVQRARRWSRRQILVALTTGIAAAAVTVGLVTALNGSDKPKPQTHKLAAAPTTRVPRPTGGAAPTTQCQQTPASCAQATPVVSGPTADWMGMQIVSSPSGIVISTVRPGSAADQAGFEPGDEIEQVNGHSVDSIDRIRDLTAGIALGKSVSIQVLRGSAIPEAATLPMTERPIIHP